MPPSAMIAPASTKNGMVSIATLLTPSEIFSMTASGGIPIHSAADERAEAERIGNRHADAKQKNSVPSKMRRSMALFHRQMRVAAGAGRRPIGKMLNDEQTA